MSRILSEGAPAGAPAETEGILKRFLEEEGPRLLAKYEKRTQIVEEWIGAVDRFLSRARNWLLDSDTRHILDTEIVSVGLHERGIGGYFAKGLKVKLGLWGVDIKPRARYAVGALSISPYSTLDTFGRIDLTNGLNTYAVYRLGLEPDARWLMIDDFRRRPEVFDRGSFEHAMKDLLE